MVGEIPKEKGSCSSQRAAAKVIRPWTAWALSGRGGAGEMLVSCLQVLALCTVGGLCCCRVNPETNTMLLQDPFCHPSQLACCVHGCRNRQVCPVPLPCLQRGAPGLLPSSPSRLWHLPAGRCLPITVPGPLMRLHPAKSREQIPLCRSSWWMHPHPVHGEARQLLLAPRGVPPPQGCASSLLGGPGCQAARGRLCGTGSLPAHVGSPAEGGPGWRLPEGRGVQPALGGAVGPALGFFRLLPSEPWDR